MVRHPAGGLIGKSGSSPQLSYPLCVFDPRQEFGASWIACNARSWLLSARPISALILCGEVVSLRDMTEIQLLRPEGLVVSPAFSHVAVVPAGATMVYVGGQNAVDQNGELVGGTDVAAQTRQVMANLVTALQAAGVGIEHLVSVLVLLVEGVDVQAAYAAAAATLGAAEAPPLVSAAIVYGLGVPGAMVEVSAIAATPDRAPTD